MGGPAAIREWLDASGGLTAARGLYRPGRPEMDADQTPAGTTLIPVAWLGRTSTDDQQDPVGSLLRQLRVAQAKLPEECVIVAHYYDVESGRKDLELRGRGSVHERFNIPIPRDGGVQDLLTEATAPTRRFEAVLCEQIDRVARLTYYGTKVEHELRNAGVALWAADERIDTRPGPIIDPTNILTRRVKQGVAEWYALDMLKRAWDGFETHTEQGYNVGKPCYGYRAQQISLDTHASTTSSDGGSAPAPRGGGHRGKNRTGPRTKTKLVPDPVEAAVVAMVYQWRLDERLGYRAIAERLNLDPASNPPPTPVDPARRVGRWTISNVRELLTQPKYTGYMVWNRRASRTRHGKANPVQDWVWSSQPTHEAIIDLDTFIAAQQVVRRRERSRTQAGANSHPDTKRSYLLRSYLFCEQCGRRMFGKTRRQRPYYACAPRAHVPDGHPGSLWINEAVLLDGLDEFLNQHVFGTYRRDLLATGLDDLDQHADQARTEQIAALHKATAETEARRRRLVQMLELAEQPDQDLFRDVQLRRAELKTQRGRLEAELDALTSQVQERPNPALLNTLPIGVCDLTEMPEAIARRLFEALRLEIHYNKHDNTINYIATLTGETVPALQATANNNVVVPLHRATITDEASSETAPAVSPRAFPSVASPAGGTPCYGDAEARDAGSNPTRAARRELAVMRPSPAVGGEPMVG